MEKKPEHDPLLKPPPAYSPSSSSKTLKPAAALAPPAYAPPSAYTVGANTLREPLVHVHQLKAHLALLRAFKSLRLRVEAEAVDKEGAITGVTAQRWAYYVGLAVERFQKWLPFASESMNPSEKRAQYVLPPVDVLMVWHAYMLNPFWYAEDCDRRPELKALKTLGSQLLIVLCDIGDINAYEPPQETIARWRENTGTPYDLFEAETVMKEREVACPKCCNIQKIPFLFGFGRGYLQREFGVRCEVCDFEITRERLAVVKFLHDLSIDPGNLSHTKEFGDQAYLAGTLRSDIRPTDVVAASRIKQSLYRAHTDLRRPEMTQSDLERALIDETDWSLTKYLDTLEKWVKGGHRRVQRIMSAYVDDRPFSIELVGAVLRQGSFIDKMHGFGWTEPGYFDGPDNEVVLMHAIARYHAFLDLLSSAPGSFFVPTLDIDLAWHTHQMMGEAYLQDCLLHVGRYIDHDDKVGESHLTTSFDLTTRAWEQRFKVPYTHCGCPHPGEKLTERVSRYARRLSQGALARMRGDASRNPLNPLIPPHRPDALSATHASEHNAVLTIDPQTGQAVVDAQARKDREERIRKRKERDAKDLKAGKMDEEEYRMRSAHATALLYPVPFDAGNPRCATTCGTYVPDDGCNPIERHDSAGGCCSGCTGSAGPSYSYTGSAGADSSDKYGAGTGGSYSAPEADPGHHTSSYAGTSTYTGGGAGNDSGGGGGGCGSSCGGGGGCGGGGCGGG